MLVVSQRRLTVFKGNEIKKGGGDVAKKRKKKKTCLKKDSNVLPGKSATRPELIHMSYCKGKGKDWGWL